MRPEHTSADASDQLLIGQVLAGSELAFRRLYRRHTPRLRMTVLRLVRYREADADDVVQDAWIACCRGLSTFRGDAKFSTWLTLIALRMARQRMAHAFATAASIDEIDTGLVAHDAAPIDAAIDAERALRLLEDRERVVFTLHYLEGLSHAEIARELDVAIGTSRAILSRALAKLRAHFGTEVSS